MKKNIWMMAGCMAALTIATTGCNHDELAETTGNGTFVITASTPTGADTRLDYKDERDHLKITWLYNPAKPRYTDNIYVFAGDNAQTPVQFEVKSLGADAHNATFGVVSGSSFSTPPSNTKLYAFYQGLPQPLAETLNLTAIPLNLTKQGGCLERDSLMNAHSMYATAIADGTDKMKFSFSHVTAMIKLVLTFSDAAPGDEVGWVGLSSPDIHNKATLNMTNGQIAYDEQAKGNTTIASEYIEIRPGLEIKIGIFTLNENKATTVWLSVFPESLTNVKVIAKSRDQTINYEGSLDNITLEAGRMYTATATLTRQP